eukprot:7381560-Prymnesium_polylepis.1
MLDRTRACTLPPNASRFRSAAVAGTACLAEAKVLCSRRARSMASRVVGPSRRPAPSRPSSPSLRCGASGCAAHSASRTARCARAARSSAPAKKAASPRGYAAAAVARGTPSGPRPSRRWSCPPSPCSQRASARGSSSFASHGDAATVVHFCAADPSGSSSPLGCRTRPHCANVTGNAPHRCSASRTHGMRQMDA